MQMRPTPRSRRLDGAVGQDQKTLNSKGKSRKGRFPLLAGLVCFTRKKSRLTCLSSSSLRRGARATRQCTRKVDFHLTAILGEKLEQDSSAGDGTGGARSRDWNENSCRERNARAQSRERQAPCSRLIQIARNTIRACICEEPVDADANRQREI